MPTSSQALVILKHLTDFNLGASNVSDNLDIPFISFPDINLHQNENTLTEESSQHQSVEFCNINTEQSSPRKFCESKQLPSCISLPPIASQQVSSICYDSKESAATAPESKQLLVIDLRETESALTVLDHEAQSSKGDSNNFYCEWNHAKDGEDEIQPHSSCEKISHGFTNTGMNPGDEHHVQDEETRSITPEVRNYQENVSTTQATDLPYCNISEDQNEFISSYYDNGFPVTGYSFSKPKIINKTDLNAGKITFEEYDLRKKKPLLACVLNLNICGQPCPVHEDRSSCMGVFSYNHQMKRHIWSLVPQKLRPPRANIRGSFVKSRKFDYNLPRCTFYDQEEKMTNYQCHQKLKTGDQTSAILECMQIVNNGMNEIASTDFASEGCQRDDNDQVKDANNISGGLSELSSNSQQNTAINNWKKGDEITKRFEKIPLLLQKHDNLTCSGIINNESYFFNVDDNVNNEPRFLETLISVPKSERLIERFMSSPPLSSSPCKQIQFCQIDCLPPLKENTIKPAFRTFTGLTSTQKEKAISIAQMKNQTPKKNAELSKDVMLGIPSFMPYNSSEIKNSNVEVEESNTSDVDTWPQPDSYTSLSVSAESKVIGMRPELPPSHPSRLCFRTSLSGCSHMEVLTQIQSQKNVKVTWLQYEPTSLYYSDIASTDYRHVSMWLFELSPDSDVTSLLLEGFKLRGLRMNILHLDDVYREEYRTFNLCNEIYMEQRSKNLIKNKSRHFLKSTRLFNIK